METRINDKPPDDMAARDEEFAAVAREHPLWDPWAGVAGLLYARRPRSSPPMCVRSRSPDGLREAIIKAEEKRGLR